MKRFLFILDKAIDGMSFLAGVSLIFIMFAVCGDVLLRTFFKMPQIWVTEVIECMLLYITFLAAAWLLREEGHVQVDILITRLKPRTVAMLGIASSIIGIFVSLVLTIFGTSVTWDYYQRGVYTPSAMEIPVYLILLIIPIGSLFLLFQFIRRAAKNFAGFIIEKDGSGEES
ncbi:MAG: TRAP transporter small permease [Deltaproteobacteria bacterium]|nr:TRAP transporter small permease [Deltaproteobacteria bacterium]MBW2128954.1 TRAP transporter small permease [Deltaproteobacteria bacterium]MBW2302764.1 TRAP transporter small permease [Deltaproteobacteria bacterium]